MIRAGDLKHRVTFCRRVMAPDGYGNQVGALADLFTVWAQVMEARGREVLEAGRLGEIAGAVLTVRQSSQVLALLPSDTVKFRGHLWNIRSGPIDLVKMPGFLEFALERGVAI